MANDRYRYGRESYRDRDFSEREDDGYIARRGFGNRRSGYAPSEYNDDRRRDADRYGRGRDRDYGDSAGYGSGGSALDWHDVVGDERTPGGPLFDFDRGRDRDRGDWGYPRSASGSLYGLERDRYGYRRDEDRYGAGYFGRGSRDYEGEDRGFFERAGDEIRSWFGDNEAERRRERDMHTSEQHHRGRGPKGYQRSDQRILEDVSDRLTDDPHIDASDIDVSVSDREVTLNGTINSRFEKRHAEDLAESVLGVTHVQNNLRIQQYADAGMGGSMLSGAERGAATAGAASIGSPEAEDSSSAGAESRRRRTPTA